MKTKQRSIIPVLLFSLFLLSSCNDGNEPEPLKGKKDIEHWGYFKGRINEDKISLENEQWDNRPVWSLRSSMHPAEEWGIQPDTINIMATSIEYNERSELIVTLYDLKPGERDLTLPVSYNWYESSIRAIVHTGVETKNRYRPDEENPFRVEITDVVWISPLYPIIEVKLEGVLYNEENSEDAIVINGEYGTR